MAGWFVPSDAGRHLMSLFQSTDRLIRRRLVAVVDSLSAFLSFFLGAFPRDRCRAYDRQDAPTKKTHLLLD